MTPGNTLFLACLVTLGIYVALCLIITIYEKIVEWCLAKKR